MVDCRVVVELEHKNAKMPQKAHITDACYDLYACEDLSVYPGESKIADLGFRLQLSEGWEAQIRGRSGLAKRGFMVHFGTIDHLYRKNVGVLVYNISQSVWSITSGDRIAQLYIGRVWNSELIAGAVQETERGGFGSTGF